MKIVSTSYIKTKEYSDPRRWLNRIDFFTGILEELAKEHEVMSIERINYEGEVRQNGVHYYFMRLKNKVVRFPFRMHQVIKNFAPDVVLVNGSVFPLQTIQLRMKLGSKPKIFVLHHAEKPATGARRWLQKLADKCVNGYFFVSEEFGDEWIKKGIISDKNKIHEAMEASSNFFPADKQTARSRLKLPEGRIFLWVGRLNLNKDPITVVKAFKEFLKQERSASLYMIFQTTELLSEIKKIIEEDESTKTTIILVGEIAHHRLQDWYNASDFIISGSHYEGSGIAVCEAMSCGCIPILTNIISFRKMTGPGKCGLLYEPGDEQDLFRVLVKAAALDLPSERMKTLDQFNNELSFKAIARRINQVIIAAPQK